MPARRSSLVAALAALALLSPPTASSQPPDSVTLSYGTPTPLGEVYGDLANQLDVKVLFDETVRVDGDIVFDVGRLDPMEAVTLLEVHANLFHVELFPNIWLVAPHNQSMLREHSLQVVRRFVLEHANVTEVNALLRGVIDLRKTAVDEWGNALTVRDHSEVVDLAARLIAAIDQPRGEVEVEVVIARVEPHVVRRLVRGEARRSVVPTRDLERALEGDDARVVARPVVTLQPEEAETIALTDGLAVPGAVQEFGFEATLEAEIHPGDAVTLDVTIALSDAVSNEPVDLPTRRRLSSTVRLEEGASWIATGLATAGAGSAGLPLARTVLAGSEDGSGRELLIALIPRIRGSVPIERHELDVIAGTGRRAFVRER